MTIGIEGQRIADLGDGLYLNPVLSGDRPDPTVLRDGDDYYLTYSSFEASPGLALWHSVNLVDWHPIGFALPRPIATVFASDLIKHGDRYFLYIPFIPAPWAPEFGEAVRICVIWADSIDGPWTEPIDLGITGFIDPGHVVGEDGRRYLFLSGVSRVRLTDDGLATDGEVEHVYDGWGYPDDWVTEAYALEGPKLLRRNEFFYLVSAVGGTAGPPTGHMVIVARSRSVHGPWENCPDNPIVRTRSADECWWSRGHATFVESPDGRWWAVYHGYENGYRTLGRQVLLEPISWTDDGWPQAEGGDLSRPLPAPVPGRESPPGQPLSDDFSGAELGSHWAFHGPGRRERERVSFAAGGLILAGKGSGPSDASPLCVLAGDHRYQVDVDVEPSGPGSLGGLLLFFNNALYLGLGVGDGGMDTYVGGKVSHWREPVPAGGKFRLRIVNDEHIVAMYYRVDGGDWVRHGLRFEASGHHCNTAGDLLSLRPALFAAGSGSVRFENFRFSAG